MRALIVAATEPEVAPLRGRCVDAGGGRRFDLLIAGVGMVATAARTARALAQGDYDLAFNFGLCGSFDPSIAPGQVVHVVVDRIAELGAEDGDRFLDLGEIGLAGEAVFENAAPPENAALAALPRVSALTVNTVHGSERSIADVVRRLSPQVESMEGAAFMCACQIAGVRFAQVRAVSNLVERRNRAAWQIGPALDSLQRSAGAILDAL